MRSYSPSALVATSRLALAAASRPAFATATCLALALSAPAYAQSDHTQDDEFAVTQEQLASSFVLPDIAVSTSKTEVPIHRLTRSVGVITQDDMKDRQATSVLDAIRQTPGVFVANQGGPGQMTSVSIRGGHSRYTQFRFDDIPLRDVSSIEGDFNSISSHLLMGDGALSRIEVLKGSESTLYGTAAIGGVVSLYSPKKWGEGFEASVSGEGGSFGTGRLSASVSYGSNGLDGGPKWYLHASPTANSTEGYKDLWFKQTGLTVGGGIAINDTTTLEFVSLTSLSKGVTSSISEPGQQYADSDDDYTIYRVFVNGLTLNHEFSDMWSSRLKFAVTRTERDYFGAKAYGANANDRASFDGTTYYAEFLNTVRPVDFLTVVAGAEYEGSRMLNKNPADGWGGAAYKIDEDFANYAIFGKAMFTFLDDRLNLNLGTRYNYHTEFESYTTFDVGASYLFPTNTRLYGNIASGFRAPSIYQRWCQTAYGFCGNPDLNPEKSMNYEIGLEQTFLNDRVRLGGALFWTNYRDRIVWGSGGYENQDRSKVKGWELTASIYPHDWIGFDFGFTHNTAETRNSGGTWRDDRLVPENQAVGTLRVSPIDDLTVALSGRWESSRITTTIYPGETKDDGYFTMDVAASYKLNDNWEVYGRVDNLFDEDYTVYAYGMPGIAAYGGLRVRF